MLYLLILITVVPLLCIFRDPSLILDKIFAPIAPIVASIKPFRKEVRRRSRGRSSVVLALDVTHFRIVSVGMPPIVASTRCPPVALWFLLGVWLISAVFVEFLLNW
jgi:hypothetical protein